MGYITIEPVPSGATTSLIEAAATMAAARPWQYTEPLLLHVADDGRVRGWSNLFLDGTVEGEQPGVEESDYRFIVQCLVRLAREFGVEWAIDLEDKDSGGVTADGLDDRAEELVKSLENVEDLLRGGMDEFMKMMDDADDPENPMGDAADEWSLRAELDELARCLPGAVVIRDAADAQLTHLNIWFAGWNSVPRAASFDLRGEPASLDALVENAQRLHNSDEPILIVPDHLTEDILQISPDDLKAAITALLPLPSGWVIGPADWRWLLELKFIGTAYCGAAPPTSA